MARNLTPQVKRARREKFALTDKQQRLLNKRGFPPGVHGPDGYGRTSEYGRQLREKQKAKFIYGLLEKQFRNYFKKASSKKGDTGEILFSLLEKRLDNSIFRAGFAQTRPLARQLVSHCHILVNGKKVNIPSYEIKVGEVIEIRPKSKDLKIFTAIKERFKNVQQVSWIVADIDKLSFKVVDLPKVTDMTGEYNAKLIVEFYSR
jgi:small subunit ribosomal protein S4